MRVLSLGAGVQSSTLLLMAVHGELSLDRAIFADTGWEPRAVYDWLGGLQLAAGYAGIPMDVVTAGNLRDAIVTQRDRGFASIPLHVLNLDGKPGMLRRQCTDNYKLRPVRRRLRELGATRVNPATILIGISWDEVQRMRDSDIRYAIHEYPLVDRRMTRTDCLRWLRERGYDDPPKSACIGCPYMDNARWRDLRDNRPDEWADAVAVDAAIRRNHRIDGEAFLHRSRVPLPMVDLSTPRERAAASGQVDMFDLIEDGECGAFTCMGEPA